MRLVSICTQKLDEERRICRVSLRQARFLVEVVLANLVALLATQRNFRKVNRHGVVHLIVLQVVLDQQGNHLRVRVLMDLSGGRVLPLETGGLFSGLVSVSLDCFENAGAQLGSELAEGALLLQVLNDYVL